jgi:hypothetical protein
VILIEWSAVHIVHYAISMVEVAVWIWVMENVTMTKNPLVDGFTGVQFHEDSGQSDAMILREARSSHQLLMMMDAEGVQGRTSSDWRIRHLGILKFALNSFGEDRISQHLDVTSEALNQLVGNN